MNLLGEGGGCARKLRRPQSHLRGGGLPTFYLMWMPVDGGGRGVRYLGIFRGRRKCMLLKTVV